MTKKKPLLLITFLLLISMFLTACNASTIGFLDHVSTMQSVVNENLTQSTSTISISDIKLPIELMDAEEKEMIEPVINYLDNNYITLTQQMDPKQNILSLSIDSTEKETKIKDNIIKLNYRENAFALSFGPKLNELSPELNYLLAPINNKLVPLETLEELAGYPPNSISEIYSSQLNSGLNEKSINFLKEFIPVYKEMNTDFITKEDGVFILNMNAEDFVKFLDEFIVFSLENFDSIMAATAGFYESLTDDEFNMLYGAIFPEGKAELLDILQEARNEIKESAIIDELIASWKESSTDLDMVSKALDGSSLNVRMWEDENKYYSTIKNTLLINNVIGEDIPLGATILIEDETQILDKLDIEMPTEVIDKEFLETFLSNI